VPILAAVRLQSAETHGFGILIFNKLQSYIPLFIKSEATYECLNSLDI